MQTKTHPFWLFIFILVFCLSACSTNPQTTEFPEIEPTSTKLSSPTSSPTTPSQPSQTLIPTATPTSTPKPLPSKDPFQISEVNAANITLLKSIGGSPLGAISHLTWSPDGKSMFVSGDQAIAIYDPETLSFQRTISKPDYYAFINQGQEYITLNGNQLSYYKTSDGSVTNTIEISDLKGDRFLISPNGHLLAANTLGSQITIWNLDTTEVNQVINLADALELDIETITSKVFSEDSSKLFAATFAGGVYQIAIESGEIERIYQAAYVPNPAITDNIRDECFLPSANGNFLVVICAHYTPSADFSTIASSRYTVKWVDANNDNHQKITFETKNSFSNPSVSPDGKSLYMQGVGEFRLLEYTPDGIENNSVPNCLKHSSDPFSIAPSEMNLLGVINSYETGEILICDLLSGDTLISLHFEQLASTAVTVSRNDYWVAVGNCAGSIEIWDTQSSQIIRTIAAHPGCVTDLDFSIDGKYLASGGDKGKVAVWDMLSEDNQPVYTYLHPDKVNDVSIDHDGTHIASISRSKALVYDVLKRRKLYEKELERGQFITLGLNDLIALTDNYAAFWRNVDGVGNKQVLDFDSLIFGADASFISQNHPGGNSVWFFDARTAETMYILELGSNEFHTIGISPDGCTFFGFPENGEIGIWNVAPFSLITTLDTGIVRRVNQLVDADMSPDGHLLVLGTEDGNVLIWGIDGALDSVPGLIPPTRACGKLKPPTATPTGIPASTETPTSIPPTPTPVTFSRNLYLTTPNLQGADVLALQERLLELGYTEVGQPDGYFGAMTDEAVKRYQSDQGLVVDGIVGPVTWEMLFNPNQ